MHVTGRCRIQGRHRLRHGGGFGTAGGAQRDRAPSARSGWVKPEEADSGAVTLIQRLGSAANLNAHLHCLVLVGVYRRCAEGSQGFVEAPATTDEALQALVQRRRNTRGRATVSRR